MKRVLERFALGRRRGRMGEDAAARYLRSEGYRVLERNWRSGRLELDLVCRHGDTLVFVEVKTRGAGSRGTPADGLDRTKMRNLVRAAHLYLAEHECWDEPCRFDLVAVLETGDGLELDHVPDAFQA
ncbi:YraN family protein [Pseudodesulfovibrio senegalensis]|jgi:putative endonuclease|uniref:UPF0102 protein F8A88_09085 n=1 Tax=Pseudodesulfovibrio senegalensis TaxID=1721087 RepID=A0A6N6N254_9BACT|nr:YraN family protein [Pseudodesulfovibrio senegalensis]KAB1441738.1 YraN family protein [Pseudodesulfovibrio senegalensis]